MYINHHINHINYHYYFYSRKENYAERYFKCLTKLCIAVGRNLNPESSSSLLLPSIITCAKTDSSAKKLLNLARIKNKQTNWSLKELL